MTPSPLPDSVLDNITDGYLTCALWDLSEGSTDNDPSDLPESIVSLARDAVRDFAQRVGADQILNAAPFLPDQEKVGHDLYLTSEGHGAGFWDGGWSHVPDFATLATRAAEACGSADELTCAIRDHFGWWESDDDNEE